MSPGSSSAGPRHRDRRTAESTTTTQAHLDVATADRRARARRVEQMQRALRDARLHNDDQAAGLLAAWLDVEYVRRSYQRADDPIVRRYRRLLREAG
jgi:hypothetical protein